MVRVVVMVMVRVMVRVRARMQLRLLAASIGIAWNPLQNVHSQLVNDVLSTFAPTWREG